MTEMTSLVELRNDKRFLASSGIENRPGCYAVFDPSSACLYVGASKRVLNRVMDHFIDRDEVGVKRWRISGYTGYQRHGHYAPQGSWIATWPSDDFGCMEIELIRRFLPVGNSAKCKKLLFPEFKERVMVFLSRKDTESGLVIGECKETDSWKVHLGFDREIKITMVKKDHCEFHNRKHQKAIMFYRTSTPGPCD